MPGVIDSSCYAPGRSYSLDNGAPQTTAHRSPAPRRYSGQHGQGGPRHTNASNGRTAASPTKTSGAAKVAAAVAVDAFDQAFATLIKSERQLRRMFVRREVYQRTQLERVMSEEPHQGVEEVLTVEDSEGSGDEALQMENGTVWVHNPYSFDGPIWQTTAQQDPQSPVFSEAAKDATFSTLVPLEPVSLLRRAVTTHFISARH